MDVQDILRLVRRHWRLLALTTLLGIIASAVYTLQQPAVYSSSASGYVRAPMEGDNPGLGSVSDNLAKSKAATYVIIARSSGTAQRVVDELGLDTTGSALASRVTASQPEDSTFVNVSVNASTPEEAQAIANAWVRATAAEVALVETGEEDGQPPLTVVPVENAELSSVPVSPDPQRNIAIGAALGLAAGAGFSLVRNQIDRRLRSKTEIERRFGVPVIGSIPKATNLDGPRNEFAELVTDPRTQGRSEQESAEAFRKLRTNLQFLDVDNPPRIVVVSSPFPGDGKSTLSANLAATIAVSGQPVLLIDGDLRRPTVAGKFGLVEGGGLTDLLIGRADPEDVMQSSPRHPNLAVIGAGDIPPNPSEMLGSKAMGRLLHELAEDYVVIIDAPPLLPVTDAALLATNADGIIITITAGKTLDTDLEASLNALERVRANPLGIIINRVPQASGESGHYGGYYGTYYTSKDGTRKRRTPGRGSGRKARGKGNGSRRRTAQRSG